MTHADGSADDVAQDIAVRYRQAITEFNTRFFFECHETLEGIWIEDTRAHERRFFQGLLQVGVGYLHLSNLNYRGAVNLLTRGIEKLERFRPAQYGVDVDAFLADVSKSLREIERLGPDSLELFDPLLIPTIDLESVAQLEAEWET